MITREQALSEDEFHDNEACFVTTGPRGGVKRTVYLWRRNGATQTWRTRPDDFRIPVKYGMRSYGSITPANAREFHLPADCPLN